MVNGLSSPRRLSWLALFCASMIVLAWAAPLLVDALPDFHARWSLNSSRATTDPHDAHTHLGEMLDEPLLLTSISGTALHQLTSSFLTLHLTIGTWSPLPLFHPPSVPNSN
jgi:hypothetical protein